MTKKILGTRALLLIIILLVLARFFWINRFPPGLNHDELEFVLSSKTYSLFGTDLSGYGFPLSLFKTETLGQISALPPMAMAPFWFILPLNYQTARIPHAIVGVLTAIFFGLLCQQFFRKKNISYLAVIVFLMNPWSFSLSRFAVDTLFSLFFYIAAIVLYLSFKEWKIIIPLVLFLLGFFSYISAKILFFPVIIGSIIYKIYLNKNNKQSVSDGVLMLTAIIVFSLVFFFISSRIPGATISGRANEIIFFDQEILTKAVNTLRNQSIALPLKALFINKFSESIKLFITGYFAAFSPSTLFVAGENLFFHGLFYLFDIILLVIGGVMIGSKHKKEFWFLIFLLLIAPIPTALSEHGQSIVNRSFLLMPVLLVFITYGLYEFCRYRWTILLAGIILFISFSRFFFIYFYQLPVFAQESNLGSYRVLAKYLLLESSNKNIIVITNEPRPIYLATILSSPASQQSKLLAENKKYHKYSESFYLKNITFTKKCPSSFSASGEYILESVVGKCTPAKKATYLILNQRDAGDVFRIYNGQLCEGLSLNRYQYQHLLSDYDIEKMTKPVFCQRWIASSH